MGNIASLFLGFCLGLIVYGKWMEDGHIESPPLEYYQLCSDLDAKLLSYNRSGDFFCDNGFKLNYHDYQEYVKMIGLKNTKGTK